MVPDALSLNLKTPCHCQRPTQLKRSEVFRVENDLSFAERWVVADSLVKIAQSSGDARQIDRLTKEAVRYRSCGQSAVILHCPNDNLDYYIRALCRSRICEPCSRRYVRKLYPRIIAILKKTKQNNPRFILAQVTLTVTTQRFGDSLPDRLGIKRLYRESRDLLNLYFGRYVCHRSRNGNIVAKLRKKNGNELRKDRRIWQGAGWFAVVEIGRDNNNLHIHALTWGRYRAVDMLRREWQRITGDSFGVHIRQKSITDAANYVLKYLTKPPATDSYLRLAQYAEMIKGSRRFRCGGIFYGELNEIKVSTSPLTCFMCQSRLRYSELVESVSDVRAFNYFDLRKKLENDLSGNVLAEIERAIVETDTPYNMPF